MRVLLSALMTVLASLAVAAAEVGVTPVQTKLVSEGTLSPDELRMVIQLAADCGVTNVESMVMGYDGYMSLSSDRFIHVASGETIIGRKVFSASATIHHDRWLREPQQGNKHWKTNGGFWLERHEVRRQELTIFTTGNKTFRVQLSERIQLALADKIVAALWNGKTSYAMKGLEDLKGVRLITESIKPTSFGKVYPKPGIENYSMSFQCREGDGGCSKTYFFTFDGNEVTIVDFTTIQT